MLQFEKRQRKLILVYTKAGCNNLFSPKIMSSRPLFSRVSSSLVAFTFTIAALYGLPLHLLFQLATSWQRKPFTLLALTLVVAVFTIVQL